MATFGRSSRTPSSARKTKGTKSYGNYNYSTVRCNLERKLNSYRTLYAQTQGRAPYGRPTPTVLNSFTKWIDKGAILHRVSPTQIYRWAKTCKKWKYSTSKFDTPTAAKNVLKTKYGTTFIKGVTKDKQGWFLVATPPMWHGRPFNKFPR